MTSETTSLSTTQGHTGFGVAAPQLPRGARYTYGPVIGRGGMGEVVSARDEQFGRWVAIKRLHAGNASPGAVGRFVREAQIQGRLEHPAIVPVHELWYDSAGQPCFAMKQLAGTTLADILERLVAGDAATAKTHTQNRLLQVFIDVCLAVELAHTRGVVHCDLKPANIALGDFGEVYVLDWGIAQLAGGPRGEAFPDLHLATGTGATPVAGTPGYMSPEQVRGDEDLDGRSDVYSLGCVLFEILTRQALHPRGILGKASVIQGLNGRPSARAPHLEIAPELDAICLSALALDRDARPSTARALADAVRRYLDGDRDLARRKDMATESVAHARAALAEGDGIEHRREALRAAGRALALDPTNPEPAELVAGLLVQPIRDVPPEVDAALDRLEAETMAGTRWISALCAIVALAMIPLFYVAGVHSPYVHIAFGALMLGKLGIALATTPRNALVMARIHIPMSLGIVAIYAYILTPLVVAPAVATATAIAIACSPRRVVRSRTVIVLSLLASLAPWLLGAFGIGLSTTFAGSDIILHTGAAHLHPILMPITIVVCQTVAVTIGVLRARVVTRRHRLAQREIQMREWQLRQLV